MRCLGQGSEFMTLHLPWKQYSKPACSTESHTLYMQVWDVHTCELVKQLPSQNHWVRALVTYGKYLYSGSYQAVKVHSVTQHIMWQSQVEIK